MQSGWVPDSEEQDKQSLGTKLPPGYEIPDPEVWWMMLHGVIPPAPSLPRRRDGAIKPQAD